MNRDRITDSLLRVAAENGVPAWADNITISYSNLTTDGEDGLIINPLGTTGSIIVGIERHKNVTGVMKSDQEPEITSTAFSEDFKILEEGSLESALQTVFDRIKEFYTKTDA